MVAREAMAHGRAVVATSVGGLADAIVDGETGLLVPPRDPAALRAALVRLLEDPGLRRRQGGGGMGMQPIGW
ncbi:MAG: glycosyltransferase, partial [Gaiellaceae bacterium]